MKFHDGTPLTADDVVYTVNLVADPASKVSTPVALQLARQGGEDRRPLGARQAEAPEPGGARIFRDGAPDLSEGLSREGRRRRLCQGAGRRRPVQDDQGRPGVSIDFERFEDYWAGSPKGKPAIKKMSVRFVPDATTEMTELLAGRADWIWNMNPDQFENVNKLPHLAAVRKESMRVGYLSLDAAGRTGADNPITKLKVRQAVWHAIDRQAIADKLVTGGSRVPHAPCFPPQFGCDAEIAVLYDYDPAKAKQLLAEAGYPERLRRRADELCAAAMGRGGAELPAGGRHPRQAQPDAGQPRWSSAPRRASCAVSRKLGQLFDQRRVGDPAELLRRRRRRLRARSGCHQWLVEGGSSNDPEVRKKAYSAAIQRITEQAYWAPLHTYVTTYGYSKAARLHALCGRAAAVLPGEVEVIDRRRTLSRIVRRRRATTPLCRERAAY